MLSRPSSSRARPRLDRGAINVLDVNLLVDAVRRDGCVRRCHRTALPTMVKLGTWSILAKSCVAWLSPQITSAREGTLASDVKEQLLFAGCTINRANTHIQDAASRIYSKTTSCINVRAQATKNAANVKCPDSHHRLRPT